MMINLSYDPNSQPRLRALRGSCVHAPRHRFRFSRRLELHRLTEGVGELARINLATSFVLERAAMRLVDEGEAHARFDN